MKQTSDTYYNAYGNGAAGYGKAAIYTRLSLADDDSTATQRQEKECRDFAKAEGLTVVEVYCDEGISGFKQTRRPAFEQAIADLEAGHFSTLIVWKLDRLTRQGMGAVGTLIDRLGDKKNIMSVVDRIDSSKPQGRMMIAILSEMAYSESFNNSTRSKAQRREARRIGRHSAPAAWCYNRDENGQLVPKPECYTDAREAVEMALRGATYQSIADMLNDRGQLTRFGKRWMARTVRKWLLSPTIAGLVAIKVENQMTLYIDPESGEPVNCGTGIATEEEWRQLKGRMSRDSTGSKPRRDACLLTGIARCGLCNETMHMTGYKSYRCKEILRSICPGTGITAKNLEEHVETELFRCLNEADIDSALLERVSRAWRGTQFPEFVDVTKAENQLLVLEDRLNGLMDDRYVHGLFDGREDLFKEHFDSLNAKIDEKKRSINALLGTAGNRVSHFIDYSDPVTVREAWDATPLSERRAVMAAVIESVIIDPQVRSQGRRCDLSRVTIEWRA